MGQALCCQNHPLRSESINIQGLGIDGRLATENQKQNVRQIMKDMVRNTSSKSW